MDFKHIANILNDNFFVFISWIIAVLLILYAIDRIAYISGIGRYKNPATRIPTKGGNIAFVFVDLLVKIITDFRHFLALVLVLIFAGALLYACYNSNGDIEKLSKALQAVVSTLGGLIGSIVGYYFGESKTQRLNSGTDKPLTDSPNVILPPPPVQSTNQNSSSPITQAPPPPTSPGSSGN